MGSGKGFKVGPDNLPEGARKQHALAIKRDLIHKAQVKRRYYKMLANEGKGNNYKEKSQEKNENPHETVKEKREKFQKKEKPLRYLKEIKVGQKAAEIKQQQEDERLEKERQMMEARKERIEKKKLMMKKTSKGQPSMKARSSLYLNQIRKMGL